MWFPRFFARRRCLRLLLLIVIVSGSPSGNAASVKDEVQEPAFAEIAPFVAAYAEWVELAEFSATYSLRSGLSRVPRGEPLGDSSLLRPKATGVWCKRGEFWRMSLSNHRDPLHVAAATATAPGAVKFVSWDRLCSADFVVNYFPGYGFEQAGLTSRVLADGTLSSQFHPACVVEQSILNPTGSDIYNMRTGEWTLPSFPQGVVIDWAVNSMDKSRIQFIGSWRDGETPMEVRYTFRTAPAIPVIESIQTCSFGVEGELLRYNDFYLDNYKLAECGVELPSRMESRQYPVSYTSSETGKHEATLVRVWDAEFSLIYPPPDTEFALSFLSDTSFSGFASEPAGVENFSLIGFLNKESPPLPVVAAEGSAWWAVGANFAVLGLICLAWLWRRRVSSQDLKG